MNFSLEFLLNIVVLLAQLYLGLIVILHKPKSFSNRFFLALVFFIALQGVIQIINLNNPAIDHSTRARLSLFTVPAQLLFLLLFLIHFPKEEAVIKSKHLVGLYLLIFGLMFLVATPFVFESFQINNNIAQPVQGPLFPIFAGSLAVLVLGNIGTIFVRYIRASKELKRQIFFIGFGIAVSFLSLLITQFILPNFFGIAAFLKVISVFTLPMLICIGYAVIGFRIFDVRLIPAEAFTLLIWVLFLITIFFRPAEGVYGQILIFSLIIIFGIFLTRNITIEVKQKDKLQKLTQELSAANDKLKELDKLKSEFLNFASHQVKSPMAVIKGFADLIATGAYGDLPAEAKDKAVKIKESADRTLALVGNLLDLGKIESGKMDFAYAQVDIAKVVRGMTEEYKVLGEKHGLSISYEGLTTPLMIKADEQKIRQVIQNVIDNSIKYTKEGFVKVDLKDEGQKVLITITDSGLGMSAELQKKLFGRFVRDDKTKNEIQGTGLGLYIAKQIVTAHNGEVWAESPGEGKGSTFNIRLSKV